MIPALGQLLPWLIGCFFSVLLMQGVRSPGVLHIGVGYLFGAALIYFNLSYFSHDVTITLVICAILSLVLIAIYPGLIVKPKLTQIGFSPFFWLFLLLLLLHLVVSLHDHLVRPIFPWDAWTTWSYRAKAWFLNHAFTDFVVPAEYWGISGDGVYTMGSPHYPDLTSVFQYWTAATADVWNEQWVSIPWLLIGISIALAIYGVARELKFGPATSIILGYGFVSLPLSGIHITLAGYSDIWMAGYVGLGYALVLVGLLTPSWRFTVAGLLLCGLSILVKNEGVVWFALLLWIVFLQFNKIRWLPLGSILLIVAIVVLSTLVFEKLGWEEISEGKVLIPFVGVVQLQINDVLWPFIDNLFVLGNWNLFWYLVIFCLLFSVPVWHQKEVRVAWSLIFWPFTAIVTLFVFSEHGAWAVNYTAINRLLLHFMPVWILALALIVRARIGLMESAEK